MMKPGHEQQLTAYADANWGGESGLNRRSRTSIVVYYGNKHTRIYIYIYISCCSQKGVSLSCYEAEYIALSVACKIIAWLKQVLT